MNKVIEPTTSPKQSPTTSLAEVVSSFPDGDRDALFGALSNDDCEELLYDWQFWARPGQLAPAGNWLCWLVLAGRGFGKTRMGAEWVKEKASLVAGLGAGLGGAGKKNAVRIALVAHTFADGRDVMIEGDSGILAQSPPHNRPKWEPSRRKLTWPNGSTATLYSSEEPDQLRGPQHHFAWVDELAKWREGEDNWSNLMMGLRLGAKPQVMITTTPRPTALINKMVADDRTVVTRGSTFDNHANLSPAFLDHMHRLYSGTRLGRQELYGEVLNDVPGALWTLAALDKTRVRKHPTLTRVVVAVDPPVTHGPKADSCGIVVAGRDAKGHYYVLADKTIQGLSPNGWAAKALATYDMHKADRLVAEVNNGGDLVETIVRQLDPTVSYRAVRATRGKIARAEPIAALYEQGLVHHVGGFKKLEDQMSHYTGDPGQSSPDRLDALVWALTDLSQGGRAEPRIREM